MNAFLLYLLGTLLRGAVILPLLLAAEKFLLPKTGGRSSLLYALLLLVLIFPLAVFTFQAAAPMPAFEATENPPPVMVPANIAAEKAFYPPPSPASVPAAAKERKWQIPAPSGLAGWTGAFYIAIGVTLLSYRLIRWRRWTKRVRNCPAIGEERLLRLLAAACELTSAGRRRPALLDGSVLGSSVACCGLWRPRILFPAAEAGSWSDREITMLLAHELEHIRRRDCFTMLALYFAGAFYWFNPVFFLLHSRLLRAREIECDAAVLKHLNLQEDGRRQYARLLIDFQERSFRPPVGAGAGLSENAKDLKQRILEVVMNQKTIRGSVFAVLSFALIAAAGLLAPVFSGCSAPAAPADDAAAKLNAEVTAYRPPELETQNWLDYETNTRKLVDEKKYDEALVRHRWYFDNILKYQESLVGVRLSFALMYWKELGAKYPPALAEMVRLRDEKEAYLRSGKARLMLPVYNADGSVRDFKTDPPKTAEDRRLLSKSLGGDAEMFDEVNAFNRTLGEEQKTIELFRYLDQHQPEFAKKCFRSLNVRHTLLKNKEFVLVKKYIPNLADDWEQKRKLMVHDVSPETRARMKELMNKMGRPFTEEQERDNHKAMLRYHWNNVDIELSLVRACKEDDLAARIEREATELLGPRPEKR